jgi:hypothetical protein
VSSSSESICGVLFVGKEKTRLNLASFDTMVALLFATWQGGDVLKRVFSIDFRSVPADTGICERAYFIKII